MVLFHIKILIIIYMCFENPLTKVHLPLKQTYKKQYKTFKNN